MAKKLKDCFPMIREENELLAEIRESETLRRTFQGWPEEKQRIFLDCCTGARGVKMLYDSFFKEIMNPEKNPERIEELLSLLLNRQARHPEGAAPGGDPAGRSPLPGDHGHRGGTGGRKPGECGGAEAGLPLPGTAERLLFGRPSSAAVQKGAGGETGTVPLPGY